MDLPLDHPLRTACWHWPQSFMYLHNHYAQFRRDFVLDEVPASAPFFITADKAYKLWVNGAYVCRGPARGYQSHWPFDEVDLAAYLKQGGNWLAVEAYNPGVSTFQYQHAGRAGLICAAGEPRLRQALELAPWQMRRSPAHNTQTAHYSLQIDFQEHVDLRLDDRAWIHSPRPPQGWEPRMFSEGSQQFLTFPFGTWPYDTMEPRGIPLLRETLFPLHRATCHAYGPNTADYADWSNVSWGWYKEMPPISAWQSDVESLARIEDGALVVDVEPPGPGRWHAITLDAGRMIVGHLELEAVGAAGGEVVDFQYYQTLRDGKPRMIPPGHGCAIALANRVHLAAGRCRHAFFHPLGFRHVTLIVRNAARPITFRLRARSVEYPFTMAGRFESSDAVLNDVHAACRHTQQLCALDAYVDTPWREQAQWWGDARVQAANTLYLDGDARLLARGIRSIAGQSTSFGLTFGHAPTVAGWCILPDFALTWILTVWDHYWQTGDTAMARQMWPRIKSILDYFHSPEARGIDGLLRFDPRYWYFGDAAKLYREAHPTFLNLWYLLVLDRLLPLLGASGMSDEALSIDAELHAHRKLVIERLYDAETAMFHSGIDNDGRPVRMFSVHEQTLALMLNLCPSGHETMIHQRLLPYLLDQPLEGACPGACPSAFWSTYVLGEMARRGYGHEAVGFIRRHWQPMLSTGTTWEHFDWSEEAEASCSHAWTAHPSFHLVNILGGIRQEDVAWTRISFAPSYLPGMTQVRCAVPTPHGLIDSRWERKGGLVQGTLDLPPGVTAEVHLPGKEITTWRSGRQYEVET